uniref:Uncharacterized protein n=1 Tax=Siphoviridae sp. ct4sp3 TaxID=2825332 RepID=A0A8S5PT87_9CAUD|nr:MAG TPA: hypothetical protein [Siphoviridae sp. ct4sp3]
MLAVTHEGLFNRPFFITVRALQELEHGQLSGGRENLFT